MSIAAASATAASGELYLDLLKRIITRAAVAKPVERHGLAPTYPFRRAFYGVLRRLLAAANLELVRTVRASAEDYLESGHMATNRAEDAESMLGLRQFDSMQSCFEVIQRENVPGDLVECGVWRGGMTIFMRALLEVSRGPIRSVWVADSFEGLPEPDKGSDSYGWRAGDMSVSLEQVRSNFARYRLLDERVHFLKGYFCNTLPDAPISAISILRIDADLYESTLDALTWLYPKLSLGGYAVFDDYHNLPDCRRAIDEYRSRHGIEEEICPIDTRAVLWRKNPGGRLP